MYDITKSEVIASCFNKYSDIEVQKDNYFDKIEANERKSDSVSFVGCVRCSDGVLAFGDKKATRGNFEDKIRGQVPKVFANKDVIILTCGNNTVGNMKIEDLLEHLVLSFNTLNSDLIIKEFLNILRNQGDYREFSLFIYKQYDTGYFCSGNYLFKNGEFIRFTEYCPFYYSGNMIYVQVFNDFFAHKVNNKNIGDRFDITCEEMQNQIQELLNKTFAFCENTLSYNSVSKEFDFKTIKY